MGKTNQEYAKKKRKYFYGLKSVFKVKSIIFNEKKNYDDEKRRATLLTTNEIPV